MALEVKRTARFMALGLLGLAFAPVGVFASNSQFDRLNIADLMSDDSDGTNIVITPGNLIPEFASVTTPKISGVELFSNQAVFSFGDSSFLENTPISALHVNGDELEFWQTNTAITSNGTLSIGLSPDEIAEHLQTVGLVHEPSATDFNNFSNLTPSDAAVTKSFANELPTLSTLPTNDSHSNTNATSVATSISLNSAASSPEAVQLANPVLSREASPVGAPAVPEPASLALVGLSAMGLLLRRRAAR